MEHWETRRLAISALQDRLSSEANAVDLAFESLDAIVRHLQSNVEQSSYTRMAAVAIAKGRNLALACHSLILDGLGQESGAVLRLLVEAIEMVAYLSADPSRAIALLDHKQSAGEIARAVASKLKPLRDYLNQHSSHLSFSCYATRHLVDVPEGTVRLIQQHNDHVLRINLHILIAVTHRFAYEGARALAVVNADAADSVAPTVNRVLAMLDSLRQTDSGLSPEPYVDGDA